MGNESTQGKASRATRLWNIGEKRKYNDLEGTRDARLATNGTVINIAKIAISKLWFLLHLDIHEKDILILQNLKIAQESCWHDSLRSFYFNVIMLVGKSGKMHYYKNLLLIASINPVDFLPLKF